MRNYSRNDNTGLYFFLTFLCGILLSVFGIWAIVEFILYLVKDNPFNQWSLWLTIGALVAQLVFLFKLITSD
jgi:hypothetical protein